VTQNQKMLLWAWEKIPELGAEKLKDHDKRGDPVQENCVGIVSFWQACVIVIHLQRPIITPGLLLEPETFWGAVAMAATAAIGAIFGTHVS